MTDFGLNLVLHDDEGVVMEAEYRRVQLRLEWPVLTARECRELAEQLLEAAERMEKE